MNKVSHLCLFLFFGVVEFQPRVPDLHGVFPADGVQIRFGLEVPERQSGVGPAHHQVVLDADLRADLGDVHDLHDVDRELDVRPPLAAVTLGGRRGVVPYVRGVDHDYGAVLGI